MQVTKIGLPNTVYLMLQKLFKFPANGNNTSLTTANTDCRTGSNSPEQSDTYCLFNKTCDEVYKKDDKGLALMAFQKTSEVKIGGA